MKRGSVDMLKLLLAFTHNYIGLKHTVHIDKNKEDLLDIALQQKDNRKLACLMKEVEICCLPNGDRMHFSGMKCKSESVIQVMVNNRKKLEYLFRAVHNNKFRTNTATT